MPLLINGIDVTATVFPSVSVGGINISFQPYSRPSSSSPIARGGETTEGQRLRRLREAIHHINHRIRQYAPANAAFKSIPGGFGETLDQLLSRHNIIICLDPAHAGPLAGATPTQSASSRLFRISITAFGFSSTGRSVEATILHELAHVNGASNTTMDAENTMRRCRMGDQFDPTAVG